MREQARYLDPSPKGRKNCYRVTRVLYWLLQWTFGILQNLLGLCPCLCLRISGRGSAMGCYHGAVVTKWKGDGSMGLGMFIFFGHEGAPDEVQVMVHEFGHTVQSAVLGPLFLPVIGIPSWLWANLKPCQKYRREHKVSYVSFYCEKWANRWGEKVVGLPGPER